MKTKTKNNWTVRQLIFANGLYKSEVAQAIGISVWSFSHWLQNEMTDTQRERTMKAIRDLTATNGKATTKEVE